MVPTQMSFALVAASLFAFLLCIQTGDAIVCFECNSHNDSRCAQEVPPEAFKKECSEHKEGNKYKFCRKIVQSIEFQVNGLKPDTRVIRLCGFESSQYDDKCYQRSGFGGRQEVCTCQTDLCNSADKFKTSLGVVGLFSALQIMIARYF